MATDRKLLDPEDRKNAAAAAGHEAVNKDNTAIPAGSVLISAPASAGAASKAFASRWSRAWPVLGAIGSLLLLWEITAVLYNKPFILPTVQAVLPKLVTTVTKPEFTDGLQKSLFRLAVGYPFACLFGSMLGLLGGVSKGFARYLRGLVSILQSIPPITWVPFFMLLLGFGDLTVITIITIASFFPMALSVLNGTEGVSRTHLELARVLGASKRQQLLKVFAPEALPSFMTGAQVSFGNAWRSLISAEMVGGASVGLGRYLSTHSEIADMEGVLISIIVIGSIAAFIDLVLLERLKRRLLHWRYVQGGDQ